MLRIYLMRHSNAGQTNKHLLNDHERPLTKKGEELCVKIAKDFDANFSDNIPEVILASDAVRSYKTAELVKGNSSLISPEAPVSQHPELYITGDEEILNLIRGIDDKFKTALLVSHNPGLLNFALNFAGSGDKLKYREMRSNFAPGSFAVYDIDVEEWQSVKMKEAILIYFRNAKELKKIEV